MGNRKSRLKTRVKWLRRYTVNVLLLTLAILVAGLLSAASNIFITGEAGLPYDMLVGQNYYKYRILAVLNILIWSGVTLMFEYALTRE